MEQCVFCSKKYELSATAQLYCSTDCKRKMGFMKRKVRRVTENIRKKRDGDTA